MLQTSLLLIKGLNIIITEIYTNLFYGSKMFLMEFLHYNSGQYWKS